MADATTSSGVLFSDLDDLQACAEKKISAIKRILQLRNTGREPSFKYMVCKIRQQMIVLHDLLEKMELEVKCTVKTKTSLNELQETAEKEQHEAQYLLEEVLPCHLRLCQSCASGQTEKCDEHHLVKDTKPTKASKKSRFPSEMPAITPEELEAVPTYMKGRLTCDQINAVVRDINKAVMNKYKICNKALNSMNASERNLYYRYKKEDTEDTKGCYFIAEEDIKLFTCLRTDKRFQQILTILRHRRRVREVRTAGVIRYVIC